MKNRELKKELRNESRFFVPDLKDRIMTSVNIPIASGKRSYRLFSFRSAIMASMAIFLGVMLILIFNNFVPVGEVNTFVTVDINPSIEFEVDQNHQTVAVQPLNLDAALLLEETDLSSKTITESINEFIRLAEASGYLEEGEDQITVNSINADGKKEKDFNEYIRNYFRNNRKIRFIEISEETENLAKRYRISPHKMELIERILKNNSKYTIEKLKDKTIPELNRIIREYQAAQINEFLNGYTQKINQLKGLKNQFKEAFINELNESENALTEIQFLIDLKAPLLDIKQSFNENFPATEKLDLTDYDYAEYQNLLNLLKNEIDEYRNLIVSLMDEKYNTQVKSFRKKISDDLKESKTYNFDFEFDTDFSMDEYKNGMHYNSEEKRILKIIGKVDVIIQLGSRNQKIRDAYQKELEDLISELEDIMDSDTVTDPFKQSNLIENFLKRYQDYLDNKVNSKIK